MNLLITGAWQQANEYIAQIEKNHSVSTAADTVIAVRLRGNFLRAGFSSFTGFFSDDDGADQ